LSADRTHSTTISNVKRQHSLRQIGSLFFFEDVGKFAEQGCTIIAPVAGTIAIDESKLKRPVFHVFNDEDHHRYAEGLAEDVIRLHSLVPIPIELLGLDRQDAQDELRELSGKSSSMRA